MPTNHYSAFDRGFDLGHVDVPPTRSPVLERRPISRAPARHPWRKMMAIAAMVTMIATSFAIVVQTAPWKSDAGDSPAETLAPGPREVTYEIGHFFESYLKNTNYAYQGNRTNTPGLNPWWDARVTNYKELIVRNTYPFVLGYTLESGMTNADIDPGFGVHSLARLHIAAKNLTTMGTAHTMDPIFIPILNPNTPGGGNVTLQWRSDVATAKEIADIKSISGNGHFARTYYGAPRINLIDDGYWNELYGHMTFDREAAKTYLGLPGVGDLMTEFTAANSGNAIGLLWLNDWITETGGGGIYDIAAAYEYSNDIRQVVLTMDPTSLPDLLNIRIWSISWGNDMMLMRYFDVSGLNKYMETYFEDMYFNATIGVASADIDTSYYVQYAMLGWNDQVTGKAAWMLEATNIDYVGSADPPPAWQSRFNPYDPEQTDATRLSLLPGTIMYGQQVSYYTTPMFWNLASGERIIVQLPTRMEVGYAGYVGTSDALNAAKAVELNGHAYWGEMVLGNGLPDMDSYYNGATKTLTINGPTSWTRNQNPSYPELNYTGEPQFIFDITRVSTYDITVLPVQAVYIVGDVYTLNVTARDLNGTAVPWDGTITLSSNDPLIVLGDTTHTFTNTSYWETTVTFGTVSWNTYVNGTDTWFPMDIDGVKGPIVATGIPEFGLLVIPVIGAALMFAVYRKRRKDA